MRKSNWIPKEELERFYLDHTYLETLDHFNLKGGKLDRMLKSYGLSKNKRIEENEISKEDLQKYYVEENHSKVETQEHFNLTNYSLSTLLKRYGIVKERSKVVSRRKKTSLQRYGNERYNGREKYRDTCQSRYGGIGFASDELRAKAESRIKDRYGYPDIRQTEYFKQKALDSKRKKYGDEHYNNLELRRNTCLERYGEDNPQKVKSISEKTSKTIVERYGSRYPQSKVRETKRERYGDEHYNNPELRKSNNLQKYGYEHTFQIPEIKEQISKTCFDRYGVPWACMRPEARAYSNDSRPNRHFAELLENLGIPFEREYALSNRSFDFKVGDTLIEINPAATHNSTWGFLGNQPKSPEYHLEKSKLALKNGFRCVHVWDWDDLGKVAKLFGFKDPVYARKCTVEQIEEEEAVQFLKNNHLQGSCTGQKVCLGLKEKGELVQVMTFGKPRYNKNYQWELLRLCTKPGKRVIGGSEKLFKFFITSKAFSVDSVISYCDCSKFLGKVYNALGFANKSVSRPTKHWWNGKEHVTDNLLRQRGFDQLFGKQWGTYGKGYSNEELMKSHGFVEIYDVGQTTYVWSKNMKC